MVNQQTILEDFIEHHPKLEGCIESIVDASLVTAQSFRSGGRLLICGNGGSASDSEHIAGELLKGFLKKRPIRGEIAEALGSQDAERLQGGLPAIPLTSMLSLSTAFSNDKDPHAIFGQLVLALGQEQDVLLAISTSGNSENVLFAAKVAKAKGMHVIGLTGKTGGTLAEFADTLVCAPADRVDRIQEMHLPLYHLYCEILEDVFFES